MIKAVDGLKIDIKHIDQNTVYDKWTGTQTGTSTALPNSGAVATVSPLSTWQGVGQFTTNQVLQNGTSVLLDRALGGEGRLGDALQNSLANAFAAYGFNLIGDTTKGHLADGGIAKIGLPAVMGGLAAEASGGDFRTGALAAGVLAASVQGGADAESLQTGRGWRVLQRSTTTWATIKRLKERKNWQKAKIP